jgi:hypothetical protein
MQAIGVKASAAPNSVWLSNSMVDKSTPVRWLSSMGRDGAELGSAVLDINNAIAFGDNPSGNDGPLGFFHGGANSGAGVVTDGMPFISVAGTLLETPEEHRELWVGGLERGTAKVLSALVEAASSDPDAFTIDSVRGMLLGVTHRARLQVDSERETDLQAAPPRL